MTDNDLKGILDSIELHDETKDQAIAVLRNENLDLKITIQDLKRELQVKVHDLKNYTENINGNDDVLKEMIISQRREIREMDSQLEVLRDLVDKLSNELNNAILNKKTNHALSFIPGIGPKIEQKLIEIGINSVEKLMEADNKQLASRLLGVGSKSIKKWKNFLENRDK